MECLGDAPAGSQDNGSEICLVQVVDVIQDSASQQFCGHIIAPTGETLKLNALLKEPVSISTCNDDRGDNWVVRHKAGQVFFGQKSKWFTCKPDEALAERNARKLHAEWTRRLEELRNHKLSARVCLCRHDPCEHHSVGNLLHVKRWCVLKRGSIGFESMMSQDKSTNDGKRSLGEFWAHDRSKRRAAHRSSSS